jgi:hypothetical protein
MKRQQQPKRPLGNAKVPVNKEAFKMLAMEIGLNAASRKLGVPIPTGKSWAQRGGWKLPKRKGGRPERKLDTSSFHPIADVLDATHEELGKRSRTAILQAGTKAAEQAAKRKRALPVADVQQLQQLTGALARVLGWGNDSRPSVNYYGDVNTVVVCDPERRKQLIAQRQRLLEQEATQASGREVKAAAPAILVAHETDCRANVGAGNGIAAQDTPPAVSQDPVTRWRESVGKAETWKSEPEQHHAGNFGPHPEEIY